MVDVIAILFQTENNIVRMSYMLGNLFLFKNHNFQEFTYFLHFMLEEDKRVFPLAHSDLATVKTHKITFNFHGVCKMSINSHLFYIVV